MPHPIYFFSPRLLEILTSRFRRLSHDTPFDDASDDVSVVFERDDVLQRFLPDLCAHDEMHKAVIVVMNISFSFINRTIYLEEADSNMFLGSMWIKKR